MHPHAALFVSLTSLALVSAIYYCNILSRTRSWLRSNMLAMILLSLLTGLLPLAIAAPAFLAWKLVTEGAGAEVLMTAAVELVSLATLIATGFVFRALVIATYRRRRAPTTATPRMELPH